MMYQCRQMESISIGPPRIAPLMRQLTRHFSNLAPAGAEFTTILAILERITSSSFALHTKSGASRGGGLIAPCVSRGLIDGGVNGELNARLKG